MPKKRDIAIVAVILGAVVALALPSYPDYSPRSSVVSVLGYIAGVRARLESSCASGSFARHDSLGQLGVPDTAPDAHVARAQLHRKSPNAVLLRTEVTDIYGRPFFGLFPWKVIPQGSTVEFEYSCSSVGVLSARFAGSTIGAKYLPASMRGQ